MLRMRVQEYISSPYTVFTNGGHAGKKLVPSHESEALEGKQKLQMKTFSELAECLAPVFFPRVRHL